MHKKSGTRTMEYKACLRIGCLNRQKCTRREWHFVRAALRTTQNRLIRALYKSLTSQNIARTLLRILSTTCRMFANDHSLIPLHQRFPPTDGPTDPDEYVLDQIWTTFLRRRGQPPLWHKRFWQAHVAKFDVARDNKHLSHGSSSERRLLRSVSLT